MQVKTVLIEADGSGAFTYSRPFVGQILGLKISKGTLGTFDITISDDGQSVDLLALTGVAADAWYQPVVEASGSDGAALDTTGDIAYVAPVVIGSLGITVANADASGKGYVRFVLA